MGKHGPFPTFGHRALCPCPHPAIKHSNRAERGTVHVVEHLSPRGPGRATRHAGQSLMIKPTEKLRMWLIHAARPLLALHSTYDNAAELVPLFESLGLYTPKLRLYGLTGRWCIACDSWNSKLKASLSTRLRGLSQRMSENVSSTDTARI